MNKRNAAKDAVRAAKREARLGDDAVCAICGYANADALTLVRRSIVEEHHPLGRAYEGEVEIPVCANHHRELHEALRRSGASMEPPPNFLERLVSMLRALGTFFKTMGEACLRWADELARLILGLDERCPEWREEVER